eukprot:TRINITY_DN3457_c0_g1_i2.p1 TRINITY_DN3457_c0_g1~~TRINITY_DN3457_c0_g1_i2.p1  ORF type:complete len:271 (+),score=38.88 TRINITY_DN3457_c0_g1_i2:34-813(+)
MNPNHNNHTLKSPRTKSPRNLITPRRSKSKKSSRTPNRTPRPRSKSTKCQSRTNSPGKLEKRLADVEEKTHKRKLRQERLDREIEMMLMKSDVEFSSDADLSELDQGGSDSFSSLSRGGRMVEGGSGREIGKVLEFGKAEFSPRSRTGRKTGNRMYVSESVSSVSGVSGERSEGRSDDTLRIDREIREMLMNENYVVKKVKVERASHFVLFKEYRRRCFSESDLFKNTWDYLSREYVSIFDDEIFQVKDGFYRIQGCRP